MRRAGLFLALVIVASACGVSGLNFVKDERVTITSPGDRAEVTLPVTFTWDVTDFQVTGPDGSEREDAGYFGVYVDRAPQPPERSQAWLVREDSRCVAEPAPCAEASFLAQFNIFSTTERTFTVERVQEPTEQAERRREFHEVTIVLLNGRGERIGESAFLREFEVDRGSA
jgi:hypothetical protein